MNLHLQRWRNSRLDHFFLVEENILVLKMHWATHCVLNLYAQRWRVNLRT
jgi:hypothetical protein